MDNEAASLSKGYNSTMDTTEVSTGTEKVSSSAPERRKSLKPIMEKRRRARINASLTELKTFLLDIIKKEGLRHNKMEKADILELTVKHLRQLQRQHFTVATKTNESGEDNFRQGFSECASEVQKFLNSMPELEPNLQARLLEHLSRFTDIDKSSRVTNTSIPTVHSIPTPSPTYKAENLPHLSINTTSFRNNNNLLHTEQTRNAALQYANISTSGNHEVIPQQQNVHLLTSPVGQSSNSVGVCQYSNDRVIPQINAVQTVNPNPNIQIGNVIGGLQIVPTRLQSGETAYIIPTNIVANTCIPNYVLSVLTSVNSTHTNSGSQSYNYSNTSAKSSALSSNPCIQSTQINNMETVQDNINQRKSELSTTEKRQILDNNSNNVRQVVSNNSNAQHPREQIEQALNRELLDPVWRPW